MSHLLETENVTGDNGHKLAQTEYHGVTGMEQSDGDFYQMTRCQQVPWAPPSISDREHCGSASPLVLVRGGKYATRQDGTTGPSAVRRTWAGTDWTIFRSRSEVTSHMLAGTCALSHSTTAPQKVQVTQRRASCTALGAAVR